jgi:hypothetical protein
VGPANGGTWNCGYQVVETYDDMNVFAFKTVTEGLAAYAVTNFPAAAPNDSKTIYRTLLINNQDAATGGWTDRGWINGSPAGSAWAIQLLMKL